MHDTLARRGHIEDRSRPAPGDLETRSAPGEAPITVDGRRLRGVIPYDVESRDLGGWTERMAPGCLRNADLADLVATVDHNGVPLGRYPNTLTIEDRADGLHWEVELPESRADVREAVERGDLASASWRMVVGRDRWDGTVRIVEEVRALRDVAVVTTPAYPAAAAELRNEQSRPAARRVAGRLRVEDRTIDPETPETRILDAMRSVPRGESRDLTHATTSPVQPEDLRTALIERLREQSVVIRSGAVIVTTTRRAAKWPIITGDTEPAFYDELEQIQENDLELDEFEIPVKAIKALVRGSSEAFDDSDPSLLQAVADNLNTTLALKADRELTVGNDAKGFKGLTQIAGRQTIAVNGDLDWDHILKAVGLLGEAKVPGPYAVLMGPRPATKLALKKTETDSNEYLAVPAGVPPVLQCPWFPVTSGETPRTSVVVYAPAQLSVVVRQDVVVEVDRSQQFDHDAVLVRGKYRLGADTPHPQSIVHLTGVNAPPIA